MANDNQPDKVIYSMNRVTKRHGQREVLKDISLGYFYGAKIGVLGLNGAGKSSLLKIMAGVDKAFDGDVVVAPATPSGTLSRNLWWTKRAPCAKWWKRACRKSWIL